MNLNALGEPTENLTVDKWTDVPASIRNHCMLRNAPGVMRHARLGITITILDATERCGWGAGGDPASGCDEIADGMDALCAAHRHALAELSTIPEEG